MIDKTNVREELREIKKTIVKCDKRDVPNGTYIATVPAGERLGHIIKQHNRFYLCVRKDDQVSYHSFDKIPFGYSRDSLYEIETLAAEMSEQYADEDKIYGGHRRDKFVEPLDGYFTSWFQMIEKQSIINIKTGIVFPIFLPRQCITDIFKLNTYNLNTIFQEGVIVKNYCLYTKPPKRNSWRDIIGKQLRTASIATTPNWHLRIPGQPDRLYTNFVMQKGNVTVQISNAADLERIAGIDKGRLREFFANGCDNMINGWKLKTE